MLLEFSREKSFVVAVFIVRARLPKNRRFDRAGSLQFFPCPPRGAPARRFPSNYEFIIRHPAGWAWRVSTEERIDPGIFIFAR